MSIRVRIRDYEPKQDEAFLYATWCKNAYYSPKEPITKSKKAWFDDKIKTIQDLLTRSSVHIACFSDHPFVIVGCVVESESGLEWLYVKKDYRNQGVEELGVAVVVAMRAHSDWTQPGGHVPCDVGRQGGERLR